MKQIAVVGYGTVGSGVVELLEKNFDVILARAGEELRVKYILASREHADSPFHERIVRDFSVIENDPEVGVVVEAMGGTGAALDYTRRALEAGKSVVTSNKELVAKHGLELTTLAEKQGVSYLFEASVGGGIPVLRPLRLCLAGNRIEEVLGIINGTTNYILTQMERSKLTFAEALREAQRLGYAEREPSADVEGIDAAWKICILADLCFGKNVDPSEVRAEGITGVTAEDIRFASLLGYRIKLIGRALRTGPKTVTAYVAPHLLPLGTSLAGTDGVSNHIVVRGDAIGETGFCGPGAGRLPTASAVVGDIIETAQRGKGRVRLRWTPAKAGRFTDSEDLVCSWYARGNIAREVAEQVFGEVLWAQGEREAAFITQAMSGRAFREKAAPLALPGAFRVLS